MTASSPRPRILCVDDEPNVLDGLKRHLRRHFEVETESRSTNVLKRFEAGAHFAVVVSDLRMPGLDGTALLAEVRRRAPDTTRILLTGNADLAAAIAAVNEGHIFRFLSKPCAPEVLVPAIQAGVEQHRLVTAERVLLQQTLRGCVAMLTEILGLARPERFGRVTRIRERVSQVASMLEPEAAWKVELAAMLSQIARITLPPDVLDRLDSGEPLDAGAADMVGRLPEVARRLVASIPRLEDVADIVRNHPAAGGEPAPLGSRILHAVTDLDALESRGLPAEEALQVLAARGEYDDGVLQAISSALLDERADEVRELGVADLQVGMVLLDPVACADGRLLVAHGQALSVTMLERVRNFARNVDIKEPIRVLVAGAS